MAKWIKLEKDCYRYINHEYSKFVKVTAYGELDSTKPDIHIIKKDGDDFFVEVKSPKAQCCQFVLFANNETKKFDLSTQNKGPDSSYKDKIISYMNNNFEEYKQVDTKDIDTKSITVPIEKSVLYGWVNDFHISKKVKYFLTKKQKSKDYIIFPIDKFSNYFEISAVYRKKGSGSNEACQSNYLELLNGLKKLHIKGDLDFQFINNKLKCFFHSQDDSLCNTVIKCEKYNYTLINNEHSGKALKLTSYPFIYEVRKLSTTCNPTFICEIKLKQRIKQDESDKNNFENEIK